MSKLILMVGESGSGKSTRANEMLKEAQDSKKKLIRVSRDGLRRMLYGEDSSWDVRLNTTNEKLTQQLERNCAMDALDAGFDVLVDDINISENTQAKWRNRLVGTDYDFKIERMDTRLDVCILRDSQRTGREKVGRAVIERQFIDSGRAKFSQYLPKVIVDVDGTLANSDGVRSPYDESKVLSDKPYPVVVQWVKSLFLTHEIIIVSGRHSTCGEETIQWLNRQYIDFDHIYMRNGGDNRPDTIVKKEILDGLLKYFPKEKIAFVLDDRPSVVRMWKENGLTVYPVRGAIDEF